MTDEQILELLREALIYADSEKEQQAKKLTMASSLSELGIESVAAMEMAGYIEDKLNILFPDDEMAAIASVEGFATLIRRHHVAPAGGKS